MSLTTHSFKWYCRVPITKTLFYYTFCIKTVIFTLVWGSSSIGRVPPCRGGCWGFESPLSHRSANAREPFVLCNNKLRSTALEYTYELAHKNTYFNKAPLVEW